MARTVRRKIRTARQTIRDGADQRPDRSCNNHGGCPYCERNRTINRARTEARAQQELRDLAVAPE